ncbi:MAG: hypothetical protein R2912_09090 [Eubacteriales bacterium]
MKLSTRSRYGLKAVIDLAMAYGTGPVSLPVLALLRREFRKELSGQLLRELKREALWTPFAAHRADMNSPVILRS